MIMESNIKKTYEAEGVMSVSYIQRKYRLTKYASENILKRICGKFDKKIYIDDKIVRIKVTSDN